MINEWFDKLETFLKEIYIYDAPDLSSRLWNADETGFCTSMASHRVLAKKESKEVHETSGGSGRDYFTVLGAGAADGTRLPPFILYKKAVMWLPTEVLYLFGDPSSHARTMELSLQEWIWLSGMSRSDVLTEVSNLASV